MASAVYNPRKTKLDLMLDQVSAGKREITFDVRDYSAGDKKRIEDVARARGLDASSDGKYILVRDLRNMQNPGFLPKSLFDRYIVRTSGGEVKVDRIQTLAGAERKAKELAKKYPCSGVEIVSEKHGSVIKSFEPTMGSGGLKVATDRTRQFKQQAEKEAKAGARFVLYVDGSEFATYDTKREAEKAGKDEGGRWRVKEVAANPKKRKPSHANLPERSMADQQADAAAIRRTLSAVPKHLDAIVRQSGVQAADTVGELFVMELTGEVKQLTGSRFVRVKEVMGNPEFIKRRTAQPAAVAKLERSLKADGYVRVRTSTSGVKRYERGAWEITIGTDANFVAYHNGSKQVDGFGASDFESKMPYRNPLTGSPSRDISLLRHEGYPQRQAVAIAMERERVLNPEHEQTELEIFITNDRDLYRQQEQPIQKNLITKKARGVYNHADAVKLFGYLVETGAKKYAREYGGVWNQLFSVADRKAVAEELAKSFEAEADLGNYDDFLPKKYQGKKNTSQLGSRRNGSASDAASVYEGFHGEPAEGIIEYVEQVEVPTDYAALGDLVSICIATIHRKDITITAPDPDSGDLNKVVKLACSPDRRQLYFIGGDQRVPLNKLGFTKNEIKPHTLVGIAYEITYRTAKKFHKFKLTDYYHGLGEETGNQPVLLYDPANCHMSIAGGAYRVEDIGIVD